MQDWCQLLEKATEARERLGFGPDAAFRIFDGAADGCAGVFIDVFAGRWLVQTTAKELPYGLAETLARRGVCWWWKRLEQEQRVSPTRISQAGDADQFLIKENGLSFEISFASGYSQGLFIDQRDNRRLVRERVQPGQRLLNLFAYTGGFSVAAAAAGAITTTVDLSATYLDWARRNFNHNQLDPAVHYFIKGDAMDWLGAFAKKARRFDAVVLDPPTFSRTKGRGVWRAERDFHQLAQAAASVLAPSGWIFASTNCRGMTSSGFRDQLLQGFRAVGRRLDIELGGMPPDFRDAPYLHNAWCRASG